jgi:hypothetical protein
MIQEIRRLLGGKFQVDGDGVPLRGADAFAVFAQDKALLVVVRHHLPDQIQRQGDSSLA